MSTPRTEARALERIRKLTGCSEKIAVEALDFMINTMDHGNCETMRQATT